MPLSLSHQPRCRFCLTCWALGVFLLPAAFGAACADEVSVLNGQNARGSITSITGGDITLKTDKGPLTMPLSQVLAVNIRPVRPVDPAAKYLDVVLTDDTVLHCKNLAFDGKDVKLTLLSGAELKVPRTAVVSFVKDAQNQPLTRKFEELAAKRTNSDRIVILRDGQLTTLDGTLGEVKGNSIPFRSDVNPGNVVDVKIERLYGIIFFRAPPAVGAARPICKVNDVEGNTLTAVKLEHDGSKLTVTTTTGNELVLPYEVLANLDFNLGKLTFLSGMTPTKIVEKSGVGLVHSFRRDTNLDGAAIYLDKSYAKGLSMHAYTELEFNLGGKYKEFQGVLGVDPRTGSESKPKVMIYCDDTVAFSAVITAENVRPVNLKVKGVKTLRIVVSSANILDLHDHVTLAEGQISQ